MTFGECSAIQCTQNQIQYTFLVFLCFKVLRTISWKFALKLEIVTLIIVFALFLMTPTVSQQSLVNWCLVDFGACCNNQSTQNQILYIFVNFVFLCIFLYVLRYSSLFNENSVSSYTGQLWNSFSSFHNS